jgi:mannose-6-phosphate isomerase-like protein (cupin superfamily)
MINTMPMEIHFKGWGHEKWIVNNSLYCGKLLIFKKGKKCSWHFHKIKSETFYVNSGRIKVLYSMSDAISDARSVILGSGSKFDVPVGMRHQIQAIQNSEVFEFSTQHFESDSYRIIRGD